MTPVNFKGGFEFSARLSICDVVVILHRKRVNSVRFVLCSCPAGNEDVCFFSFQAAVRVSPNRAFYTCTEVTEQQ